MKSVFIYIAIHLLIANLATAQLVSVERDYNKKDYGSYYFNFRKVLRENKTDSEILALFISDSINFHKQKRYIHLQYPHTCQNRFGKIGFINTEDQLIIPFEFDVIQERYDSLFMTAEKNNRYGVIDGNGHTIIPFEYRQVVNILKENPPVFCLKNIDDKIGVLNKELNTVIPFNYTSCYIIDSNILALRESEENSLLLFYNKKGVHLFSLNGYSAKQRAGKYIYISNGYGKFNSLADKKGKWVIPPDTYEYVAWIWDNLICVPKNNLFGVLNTKGKIILPFEYSRISPTTNKQFIVYKNGMSGVVNAKNEYIIPLDSISISNFGVYYLVRRFNSVLSGLVNFKGKRILSEMYSMSDVPINSGEEGVQETNPKSAGVIRDIPNRLMGLYRADGLEILPISYTYILHRPENYAILVGKRSEQDSNRLQYAAVDINGKFIVPFSNNVLSFLPNAPDVFLSINQDKKAAFVNARTGEAVTSYEFDNDYQNKLNNGYIAAKKGWFYAIVLPDGKKLTEAVYRDVYMPTAKNKQWFDEEIVCVVKRNEILLGLTKTGKEILKVR